MKYIKNFNEGYNTRKQDLFCNMVVKLFQDKYQDKLTNTSDELLDKFEAECFNIAEEIGIDTEELKFDGEMLGYDDEDDYKRSKKCFYFTYKHDEDNYCYYEWR